MNVIFDTTTVGTQLIVERTVRYRHAIKKIKYTMLPKNKIDSASLLQISIVVHTLPALNSKHEVD